VPATISTLSAEGVPNISYLSHVYLVDSRHVAVSYQFFSKTRKNVLENDKATIEVLDPGSLRPITLKVRYLRSEFEGPVYSAMALRLQVIASHEGMTGVFSLRSADIYEVLSVCEIEGYSRLPRVDLAQVSEECRKLDGLQVITEQMGQATCLERLLEGTLNSLEKFFGYGHMKILLAGEEPGTLVTHVSLGYGNKGAGSEVKFGEGIIGLAAERRRVLQVSGVEAGLRYVQAARGSLIREGGKAGNRIPLPGLAQPAFQIAIPIVSRGNLLGVFVLESAEKRHWPATEKSLLKTVVNQLGPAMALLSRGEEPEAFPDGVPAAVSLSRGAEKTRICYVAADETIFLNDEYLIKNLAAKILWYLLRTHEKTGRRDFSNQELRSQADLGLAEVNDNLEARLVLLKKRLQQGAGSVRIVNTSRGRFRLENDLPLELSSRG
jgi:hypothetical protein